MKERYFKIVTAFILEILVSVFLKQNSYFLPLFVFIVTIEEQQKIKDLKKSLIFSFLIGLIYDIVMTNTYFLNATIFLVVSWIMRKYNQYIDKNKVTILFYFLLEIFLYRFFVYSTLVIIQYKKLSIILFIKSILYSIFLNILFLKLYLKSYKFL